MASDSNNTSSHNSHAIFHDSIINNTGEMHLSHAVFRDSIINNTGKMYVSQFEDPDTHNKNNGRSIGTPKSNSNNYSNKLLNQNHDQKYNKNANEWEEQDIEAIIKPVSNYSSFANDKKAVFLKKNCNTPSSVRRFQRHSYTNFSTVAPILNIPHDRSNYQNKLLDTTHAGNLKSGSIFNTTTDASPGDKDDTNHHENNLKRKSRQDKEFNETNVSKETAHTSKLFFNPCAKNTMSNTHIIGNTDNARRHQEQHSFTSLNKYIKVSHNNICTGLPKKDFDLNDYITDGSPLWTDDDSSDHSFT